MQCHRPLDWLNKFTELSMRLGSWKTIIYISVFIIVLYWKLIFGLLWTWGFKVCLILKYYKINLRKSRLTKIMYLYFFIASLCIEGNEFALLTLPRCCWAWEARPSRVGPCFPNPIASLPPGNRATSFPINFSNITIL